jgi:hypothetical protein
MPARRAPTSTRDMSETESCVMIGSRDLEQRIRFESACRSLTSVDTFFTSPSRARRVNQDTHGGASRRLTDGLPSKSHLRRAYSWAVARRRKHTSFSPQPLVDYVCQDIAEYGCGTAAFRTRSATEDKVSKMIWKKPTSEQWMQFGFVALFFLGIVSMIIIMAKLK